MAESVASPYAAPKTQELSRLAKKIQSLDNDFVREEISKNPRLLALSTDVPTILQEGFRYNALHVAARYGNSEATQIILSMVNGAAYMKSMYPDDPPHIREQRTKYLTDMYLNAPDKGFLETPLHFACKFGWYDVIKILIGHPLCDLTLKNKDGKMANEVICDRASGPNVTNKDKIEKLFIHKMIVPIWRDLTNDSPPIVGLPVNPKYLGHYTPKPFRDIYGDVSLDQFGPVDSSCIPKGVLGSHRDIRAYAGPIDEDTATLFYNIMKGTSTIQFNGPSAIFGQTRKFPGTPPPNTLSRPASATPISTPSPPVNVTPDQKAKNIGFVTTPTLTPKCPLTSSLLSPSKFQYTPQTLSLLLSPSAPTTPHALEDRRLRLKDPEKGLERVGRKHASDICIPWNEYWPFLGEFADLSSDSGLVLLEDHLCRLREDYDGLGFQLQNLSLSSPNATPVTSICRAMQNLNLGSEVSKLKPEFSQDWRTRLNTIGDTAMSGETGHVEGKANGWPLSQNGGLTFQSVLLKDKNETFKVAIRQLFPTESEDEDADNKIAGTVNNIYQLRSARKDSWSDDDNESSHDWRTPPYYFSSRSPTPSSSDTDSDFGETPDKFVDCDTATIYIHGTHPSKEDYQAMRAVEGVVDSLSESKFPEIITWFNCLKATGTMK